mgnify:CR=1 FL=1
MAGQCAVTNQSGKRLPGLCRQADHSGRKRFGQPVSPTGRSMASGQKRRLRPENVSPNSNRKVWWLCPLGHAWKATVTSRSREGAGCPFCAGRKVWPGFNDLETVEPKVAAQWHPTLNGQLTPRMVTAGSRRKVWWQCPEGHVWKAVVYSRAGKRKCGCPVCAGRISEARMKAYRRHGGEQQGKTER